MHEGGTFTFLASPHGRNSPSSCITGGPGGGNEKSLLAGLEAVQVWNSPALNEKKPNPETITHACPQCGGPVACGNVNGCETCWCASLPKTTGLDWGPEGAACWVALRELISDGQIERDDRVVILQTGHPANYG